MDDPQFGAAADDSGVPEQLQDQDEAELADLGLGPDEEYQDQGGEGDDDGNHEVYADEAEEEQAPVANAAMRRRQREHEQHLALLEQVKALNIKMEKAIEDDAVDVSEGRPGPRKLAMINEIEEVAKNVKDETEYNRRVVNDLLNRWMSPIIEEGRKANRDADVERARDEALQQDVKRRRIVDMEKEKLELQRQEKNKDAQVGDPGYQYHARVPRQARPDYIRAPQSGFVDMRASDGGKGNKKGGVKAKLNAATRKLVQSNKLGAASSTKVEIATKNVGTEMM